MIAPDSLYNMQLAPPPPPTIIKAMIYLRLRLVVDKDKLKIPPNISAVSLLKLKLRFGNGGAITHKPLYTSLCTQVMNLQEIV